MTQLDTTLTGIEAFRATTHDAGKNINTNGSAFSRSSRDPDTEITALAQTPTLTDNANARRALSPRTRCTVVAVAITLIQQPRKTPSSQPWGTYQKARAPNVAKSASKLGAQALRRVNVSARPSARKSRAGGTIPPLMCQSPDIETKRPDLR